MNRAELERECRTYTRYLVGQTPSEYVVGKYMDFHGQSKAAPGLTGPTGPTGLDRFDEFLVQVSARGPAWARLADAYASQLRKDSAVRKKLIVTLALLECTPPSSEVLDRVDAGGPLGAVFRLAMGGMLYALSLVISVAVFTPVRLAMTVRPGSRPAARRER
jgi:hypothetical protein